MSELNTPPPGEGQFTVVPPVKPEFSATLPPPPVGHYFVPQPQTRPTAALVIGIVLIVYAAFAVFGIIGDLINMGNPVSAHIISKEYSTVHFLLNIIAMGLYLVMGIGLIKVIPWARIGAIATFVTMTVIGILMSFYVMATMHMPEMPASPLGADTFRRIQVIGLVIGLVFAVGICITLVYFLTRPNMVEAFDRKRAYTCSRNE